MKSQTMDDKRRHTPDPACRHLLGSLSAYIDGEAEARICAEIEKHLEGCENCQVVVDSLRKTVSLYHRCSETEALPEEVRLRLYKKLNIEEFFKKVD